MPGLTVLLTTMSYWHIWRNATCLSESHKKRTLPSGCDYDSI